MRLPHTFWHELPRPIIGLAPMDGVTDAATRHITARYGRPMVTFTEFTAVEGLRAGAPKLLEDFLYDPIDQPVVAQVFGVDPEAFFQAAVIVAALGFDGIDINMGCPAKNVAQRGAGAALIRTPELAGRIVAQTRAGLQAWANGASLADCEIHPRLQKLIAERQVELGLTEAPRHLLPVSIKTRIGYDQVTIAEWADHLASFQPDLVTLHGRTLKQLYTGTADWEAIGCGARILQEAGILVLGNGDITGLVQGRERVGHYGLDGFLIGRAAIGNPWVFVEYTPTTTERLATALHHAQVVEQYYGEHGMARLRKPLLEYTKHFPGARQVRLRLNALNSLADVEALLAQPSLLEVPTP